MCLIYLSEGCEDHGPGVEGDHGNHQVHHQAGGVCRGNRYMYTKRIQNSTLNKMSNPLSMNYGHYKSNATNPRFQTQL